MDISVGPAYSPQQRDTATMRLSQVGKVLKHHVLFIALCTGGAAVGAYFYAASVPRTYTASSSITVEGDKLAIPELQGALRSENSPDPMPWVRTEVQAITSRDLVKTVVAKLQLERDPEFNAALRPPTLVEKAKIAIKALLPQSNPAPAMGLDESVLNAVEKSLAIFQDNRSLVIAAAFTAQDPRLAATFVNTLIGDYIKTRADRRAAANRGADDTLLARISEAKTNLDDIEHTMRDMRSTGEIVGLRAGSVGQQQAEELATAAAKASVDRAQLEANWNRANTLRQQGSSEALAGVLDSPTISRLRDQESVASSKVAELSSRYGSSYPGLRSAAADLASVRAQLSGEVTRIVGSLGTQLKVARDKEADLLQQLAVARTSGVKAENARSQLDQLQQEANTRRALYQTLLQREQQTVAQPVSSEIPDVRVLSAASPPGQPSGPNTGMIVGMGGLSGAVLSCLLAMLRLRSVDGFGDAADVTRATGMAVLATVRRAMLQPGLVGRVLALPGGPDGEAMRALRMRLRFAGRTGTPRCVLFTSALRHGKATEMAAALARHAAIEGEQVLLIEANFAAPNLDRLFSVRSTSFAGVLRGESDWHDSVVADPRTPLDMLVIRRRPADGYALLTGLALQNLLVEARQQYDLVVLSGPAAHASDTAALALRADTTVVLVDAQAGNPAAQDAVTRLGGQSRGTLSAILVA